MAFLVGDFHDLVRLLEEHPEWRQELRRLVLTEELLGLPELVRELAEAQRRTEERLEELAEAQRRTEERLEELAEAQRRTEERLEELAEAQRRTDEDLAALKVSVRSIENDVAYLKGHNLEHYYRERAHAYFGRYLRGVAVLSPDQLVRLLDEAFDDGRLTWEDRQRILLADAVVRGVTREKREEVYLVLEVSWGVGADDVERAVDRAARLSKVVPRAVPAVAGSFLSADARELADRHGLVQVSDGYVNWPGRS